MQDRWWILLVVSLNYLTGDLLIKTKDAMSNISRICRGECTVWCTDIVQIKHSQAACKSCRPSQNCWKLLTSLRKHLMFTNDNISFAIHTTWFFSFFPSQLISPLKRTKRVKNEEENYKYRARVFIERSLCQKKFLVSFKCSMCLTPFYL
jgi:hypothetical protein